MALIPAIVRFRASQRSLALPLLAFLALVALAAPRTSAATEHSVRLLEPPVGLHVGGLRVGAVVEGEGVARVQFLLDGRVVMSKTRPPYSVPLNLGDGPRPHEVVAIALDAQGLELARDRMSLNRGPHRFAVRLIAPLGGHSYFGSLTAKIEATLPIGEELDRIDVFVGEELAGTTTEPPYEVEVSVPSSDQTYVRAVGHLADGSETEDLVSINAPRDMEELDISFVELFTTVLDRKRQPVEGLEGSGFRVLEDGVPQVIRRFESVLDRPVHVGVLLDTSTSMQEELREALTAAKTFFERIIRPRDRATMIIFSDEAEVRAPFSNDIELLSAGLGDIEAEGETTLYDSLAFTLYYFGGLKGKRAVILLTDGADSRSRYGLSEVIEFAQRLGVAIYPIGVDVGTRNFEAESGLRRMASATGGSAFFIQRAKELDSVYARIEAELRSQYLIGYQSTSTVPEKFRTVEVVVNEPGLGARTIPGYFP
jgi:VWFA-related protein